MNQGTTPPMTDPDHKPERVCSKCGGMTGNDWSQCEGSCPIEASPHFHPQAPAAEIGGEEQCLLCAGKCRGHGLGDSSAWQPEPGSRAALLAMIAALTEALQAIEDGEGDADVIARQTLAQLGLPTLAQLNPGDPNDR